MMSLSDEIKRYSKEVHTTEMKMSIGEIINIYKDEEIIIRPEFQRLFKWDIYQKSRFIESILIGIPIPPIFVQQNDEGLWEVIDGLQRISTILQFVGELKEKRPEALVKTKFLPSLEGMYYKKFDDIHESYNKSFSKDVQLVFKRVPLNIVVIKRESESTTKYELFDRLNSGGTHLTEQEIRNAIFLIEKPFAINFIHKLSQYDDFVNSVALSEKDISNAYNEEIVLRFLAYTEVPHKFREYGDSVKEFLDNYLRYDIKEEKLPLLEDRFNKFFSFMNKHFQENSFRTLKNGKYIQGFKISKFEAIVIGLKDLIDELDKNEIDIKKKIELLEEQEWYQNAIKTRSYARRRIDIFLKEATKYFRG
jgi:hypothetical protein